MQNESAGLTRLQEKAIEGLLVTDTRAKAADYAGCSERSLYKWLQDPLFNSALLERENVLRREVGRRLAMDAKRSLETIKAIMTDEKKDPGLRLRAADLWIKYMLSTHDQTEIERRVSALEAERINER